MPKKDKRIIMTPAKAKELQEQIYWELLEQFLAAAADLDLIKPDQIEAFAARVNWYFSAQHNEKTLNEETVHAVIENKIQLIMEQTKKFTQSLDINLMPQEPAARKPAAEKPIDKPLKAYVISCDDDQHLTIVFATTANEARSIAKYSPIFPKPKYTALHAARFPQLDSYAKRKREMDWTNARDVKAAISAGLIMEEY